MQNNHSSLVTYQGYKIAHKNISQHALQVLSTLQQAGYESYLVGGSVRDLLLGIKPKDFDIATKASPEQVKGLFRNCHLIGRRFRLAHVLFGREMIEVATFRAGHHSNTEHGKSKNGVIVRDNVYGDLEDDVLRRDFTINALYFDPQHNQLKGYMHAMEDLEQRTLQLIGVPEQRYREDPVRMLRAVRFAAKLGFQIETQGHHLILSMAHLLDAIPAARLYDEMLKMFHGGYGTACFQLLRSYHLLPYLFPATEKVMQKKGHRSQFNIHFIEQALINTDKRVQEGKSINPAFLYAVFLWEVVIVQQALLEKQLRPGEALYRAGKEVLLKQTRFTSLPRRLHNMVQEIWQLQFSLEHPHRRHTVRILNHPRFRAAYDFLLLRVTAGEKQYAEIANWWTTLQEQTPEEQKIHIERLPKVVHKSRTKKHKLYGKKK